MFLRNLIIIHPSYNDHKEKAPNRKKLFSKRSMCIDVCNEMCETFMLSLVLYIDFVYVGDGFGLI